MSKDLTTDSESVQVDLLDHAGEFVARVAAAAAAEYERLLLQDEIRALLAADNAFNPGKLFAWAEFRVFRREFRHRFPEASGQACINAFCKLFLKNDISMSNLAAMMESGGNADPQKNLEQLRARSEDPGTA